MRAQTMKEFIVFEDATGYGIAELQGIYCNEVETGLTKDQAEAGAWLLSRGIEGDEFEDMKMSEERVLNIAKTSWELAVKLTSNGYELRRYHDGRVAHVAGKGMDYTEMQLAVALQLNQIKEAHTS